jgi:tryptophan synthase beta subunit
MHNGTFNIKFKVRVISNKLVFLGQHSLLIYLIHQPILYYLGSRYVPEILLPALIELEEMFEQLRDDQTFWKEYLTLLQDFSGRPTPLTPLDRISEQIGGARIWLKREDLNHSGAHKINNVLGQGLMVKRMGKNV